MARYSRNGQQLLGGLVLYFCFQITSLAADAFYAFEQTPEWVKPVATFSSVQTIQDSDYGLHDLLSDIQINALEKGNTRVYNASEYTVTNEFGIENFSSIEISFDPLYQTLKLHELTIKRDSKLIDQIGTAQFSVIPDSLDTRQLAYDGTLTMNAVLDDVQVGDVIRYAYTISGDNPVYLGNREFRINTELWTPLDRQHVRILASSERPLNRRVRGEQISVAVKDQYGIQEVIYEQRDVRKIESENDVPSWHEARGTVIFSDIESWADVADWGRDLHQLPTQPDTAVVKLADSIRSKHSDKNLQIGAALTWVQANIETVFVDARKNSRRPEAPGTTLKYGFGDSKDKAQLLVAILRELNVDANVAWVNTERGLESGDYPYRLLAFNHALVHISKDGDSHFIDPTRVSQSGALGEVYEPNYGRALVLTPDASSLTTMSDKRSAVRLAVRKELTLPDVGADFIQTSMIDGELVEESVAGLTVVSRKYGLLAEQVRNSLKGGDSGEIERKYLNYYQVLFPSIAALESVTHENSANNLSTSTERYSIEDFWNVDQKVGEHRWLYADEIIAHLDLPKSVEGRQKPYELAHPVDIQETWVVPVSSDIRMYLQEASVENEWLSFTKNAVIDEESGTSTITFNYSTLKYEVEAHELDRYVESVEQINDHASFYLQHAPVLAAAKEPHVFPWNTAKVKFWVVFIGMVYFTGWWLHFMRRYRKSLDYSLDDS